MNYYSHHIGDFIRDTARLTDSQCMTYLRLIWIYYETEQAFDNDIDAIAFKIGAVASDVSLIFKHFFFLHQDKWHQSRCDKEVLAFRQKSEKAKKSADLRWSNANAMRTHKTSMPKNANACERIESDENSASIDENIGNNNANAMRTHTERNANESLFDANQEPITNRSKKEEKINKKEIKESEPKKAAKQKATEIPKDWQPSDEDIEFCKTEKPSLDWRRVRTSFVSYYLSQTGKQAKSNDWGARWRYWVSNARVDKPSELERRRARRNELTGRNQSSGALNFDGDFDNECIN